MDLSGGRVKGPGGQGRTQESESPWKTSRSSSLGWAEPRLALAPPPLLSSSHHFSRVIMGHNRVSPTAGRAPVRGLCLYPHGFPL